VVDQVIDYTRDSQAAEFFRNMGREVRENPLPLALIGIGIAWLLFASSRTSRAAIATASDNLASKSDDVGIATAAFVRRTSEWGQQTAACVADRTTDLAGTVGDKTVELVGRARDAADNLADKARSGSTAAATFAGLKRQLTGASEDAAGPLRSGPEASSTGEGTCAVEPAYERR
jgi:hypothetical protein